VQVALHTDGLNECLSVDDTLRVLAGRTIHAFHIEGCGGGHVPNVLQLAGVANVIGSSTNPTLPFGRDALDEHYEMIFSAHGLNHHSHTDHAMVTDRIRNGTMGAEGVLHDLGVIGITSSDAQGMGRAGETVRRTFQLAAKNKQDLRTEPTVHDNDRVRQYMAKLTINPAIAHGLAHEIGSLDVGKLADIVLWRPDHFGAKPQLVLKAGFPAYGVAAGARAAVRFLRLHGRRPVGGVRQPGSARCRRRPHDHSPSPGGGEGHTQHRPREHGAQQSPGHCRRRCENGHGVARR